MTSQFNQAFAYEGTLYVMDRRGLVGLVEAMSAASPGRPASATIGWGPLDENGDPDRIEEVSAARFNSLAVAYH